MECSAYAATPRLRLRRAGASLFVAAASLAWSPQAAVAQTPPPPNDDYLASRPIDANAALLTGWDEPAPVDTSGARVQDDLFDRLKDGSAGPGGGGKEPVTCRGVRFDKTVWYDFMAPKPGQIGAVASGFNAVLALYRWDPATSLLGRRIACGADSPSTTERLFATVQQGVPYTLQVGGAGTGPAAAGGTLSLHVDFFTDPDQDGVIDPTDKCPKLPGIAREGGCPPSLPNSFPRYGSVGRGTGLALTTLIVKRVPAGARVEARCRTCHVREVVRMDKRGTARFRRILGHTIRSGAFFEVSVSLPKSRPGRYRFGALGHYYRYPVLNGKVADRIDRCLPVGSLKPRRRCT